MHVRLNREEKEKNKSLCRSQKCERWKCWVMKNLPSLVNNGIQWLAVALSDISEWKAAIWPSRQWLYNAEERLSDIRPWNASSSWAEDGLAVHRSATKESWLLWDWQFPAQMYYIIMAALLACAKRRCAKGFTCVHTIKESIQIEVIDSLFHLLTSTFQHSGCMGFHSLARLILSEAWRFVKLCWLHNPSITYRCQNAEAEKNICFMTPHSRSKKWPDTLKYTENLIPKVNRIGAGSSPYDT